MSKGEGIAIGLFLFGLSGCEAAKYAGTAYMIAHGAAPNVADCAMRSSDRLGHKCAEAGFPFEAGAK